MKHTLSNGDVIEINDNGYAFLHSSHATITLGYWEDFLVEVDDANEALENQDTEYDKYLMAMEEKRDARKDDYDY